MLQYILLTILILSLAYEKVYSSHEIGGSHNFHLSDGKSKEIYIKMINDGVDQNARKKFIQLEDRLLQVEKNAVCSGIPQYVEATSLSTIIKDMFPKYDFSYHTFHIKQSAEPSKTVNKLVTC